MSASPSTLPAGRGLLYLLLSAASWGTAGAGAALLYGPSGLGPVALTFWRSAGGAALLLLLRLVRRRPGGPVRPLDLAVNGIGLTLFQIAYFEAVHGTGLAVATVVTLGAAPVLVALGAGPLLRERLGGAGLIAVLGALGGLAVLILGGSAGAPVRAGGVLWALLSAAGYACITLYGRLIAARPGPRADALTTTLHSFLICALLLLPFGLAEGLWPSPQGLGRTAAVLLYLAAVPTAIGYALYFTGVTAVRATTVAVTALVEPVSATVLALTLFGERLAPATLVGAALLLVSVTVLAVAETRQAVAVRARRSPRRPCRPAR
ncbi:EamA family transporter [Kitasatospora sp. NBC_01287]|uniref:DMT family transporter n=1 Tax=Kitasatospora sp. NBC_01287 TaxID=2903573 RepID=UPI0022589CB6|nr:EamA family transporter [Kitasatospora sp. NBC_01287]MCX4749905.1 EamA family transporter [Kitasatospora sp. NBC_01287]